MSAQSNYYDALAQKMKDDATRAQFAETRARNDASTAEGRNNKVAMPQLPEGAMSNPQFLQAYNEWMNTNRSGPSNPALNKERAIQAGLTAAGNTMANRDELAYAQKQGDILPPQDRSILQQEDIANKRIAQGYALDKSRMANAQTEAITNYMTQPGTVGKVMFGNTGLATPAPTATTPEVGVPPTPITQKITDQPKDPKKFLDSGTVVPSTPGQVNQQSPDPYANITGADLPGMDFLRYQFSQQADPSKSYSEYVNDRAAQTAQSMNTGPIASPSVTQQFAALGQDPNQTAPLLKPAPVPKTAEDVNIANGFGPTSIPTVFNNTNMNDPKVREALRKRNKLRTDQGISPYAFPQ